jgi:hypothetical protein
MPSVLETLHAQRHAILAHGQQFGALLTVT